VSAGFERFASPLNRQVPLATPGEFQPLQLGPLAVWPPVVLAPMAGVTNYPFRSLCREFGAGLYVSEMITARGYLLENRLTHLLASFGPDERPRSIQIYGADPADVGEMVRRLVAEDRVDHIDMNFGCPVRKVTRSGGGSAIPVKPRLLARIVRAAVGAAGSVPVTMKFRKGIDAGLLTFLDAGRVGQEEGCVAVGLHGRTAAELYSGEADWDAIGELVAAVDIPVLGNGDLWEAFDALRMMRHTGCAGVIVGRGCLGRPWLFRELVEVFAGREPQPPPRLAEVGAILLDHGRRLVEFFGPTVGIRQLRKWCGWYTVGFRGSAAVRNQLARVDTLEDVERCLALLDPQERFPVTALRAHRAKGSKTQRVSLPEGYLQDRDDDRPPCSAPGDGEESESFERALSGG
jgi:nifR3 family TIM-barrel protein